MDIDELTRAIRKHRKGKGLTQHELAAQAGVSRALIAGLEAGRLPEIGVRKLTRILHALGLDLRLTTLNRRRPTFDDLREEDEQSSLE